MREITALFLLFSCTIYAQNRLTVTVNGVPKSTGNINVAVYDNEEGFLQYDKVFTSNGAVAKKGTTKVFFESLPDGEYALALFYDENGNDKLDTNWLGIPKEKVAFSNAKMRTFGPPKFKDCAFNISSDTKIEISL